MNQRTPIPIEEAVNRIMSRSREGTIERVPIHEANGRYLGEDIRADHAIPPFDRAAFDGYAIRSMDTVGATFDKPVWLEIIDAIGAGEVSTQEVGCQQAVRIMTGAPIPSGADAVIPLEIAPEHKSESKSWIVVNRGIPKGNHVSLTGEDVTQGAVLARKGKRIAAGELAMLATFGYHQVLVYQQPIVGIFATGTELIAVDEPLTHGKIRNSNSYMLESQIKQLGAIPRMYGILKDDFELCLAEVSKALDEVDFLITTGGASVGDYDFVQPLLQELGAEVLCNKIAMRPGSVTTVAHKGEKWIFGLSGNPAACYVGFELFTRPVLRTFLGSPQPHLSTAQAILEHDVEKPNRFTRLMRVKARIQDGRLVAASVGLDKSSIASALVEANALAVIPAGGAGMRQGDTVQLLMLERLE